MCFGLLHIDPEHLGCLAFTKEALGTGRGEEGRSQSLLTSEALDKLKTLRAQELLDLQILGLATKAANGLRSKPVATDMFSTSLKCDAAPPTSLTTWLVPTAS